MTKQLTIKPEKCIRCRSCTMLCSMRHYRQFDPDVSAVTVIHFLKDKVTVPVMCLQCDDPVCEKVCPTQALTRAENGVVAHDPNRCIVCKFCTQACPLGMVIYAPSVSGIVKCDLCDGDALCATWCPTKAISYLDPADNIDRRLSVAKGLRDSIEVEMA